MRVLSRRLNFETLLVGDMQYYSSVILYLDDSTSKIKGINSLFEQLGFATLLHSKLLSFPIPFLAPCPLNDEDLTATHITAYIDDLRERYDIQQIHLVGLGCGADIACKLATQAINFASVTLMNADVTNELVDEINCPVFVMSTLQQASHVNGGSGVTSADPESDVTVLNLTETSDVTEMILNDTWRTWLLAHINKHENKG